eukprot:364774-Chlamydomonas_euryale.AAC.12
MEGWGSGPQRQCSDICIQRHACGYTAGMNFRSPMGRSGMHEWQRAAPNRRPVHRHRCDWHAATVRPAAGRKSDAYGTGTPGGESTGMQMHVQTCAFDSHAEGV